MFWLEKSKPYQFYYIAIEVQIGPPMASPGCMLWGPFLVWYLRVPIGTTKRVGSPIQAISIFDATLMTRPFLGESGINRLYDLKGLKTFMNLSYLS